MQEKKSRNAADLKHAMYASMISIILALTALIGATFAWFSFSSASDESTVKSLSLDFEVYSYENGQIGALLSGLDAEALIGGGDEPFSKGSHGTKYIYVKNTGTQTLLLDIQMQIKEGPAVADAMKFFVTCMGSGNGDIDPEDEDEDEGPPAGKNDVVTLNSEPIMVKDAEIIRIDYRMYKDPAPETYETLKADIFIVALQNNVFDDETQKIYYVNDFDGLIDMLENADDGATIIFAGDIEMKPGGSSGAVEIPVFNSYNINLNGYKLRGGTDEENVENEESEEKYVIKFVGSGAGNCRMLSIENGVIEYDKLYFDFDMSAVVINLLDDLIIADWANVYCKAEEEFVSGAAELTKIKRFHADMSQPDIP